MSKKLMQFVEFVSLIHDIEDSYEYASQHEQTLEDVFELLESKNINIETVISGDMAQATLPLMTMKRKVVYESAPKGKDAEDWIIKNKSNFKKKYGDDWEQILYATAWKLFDKK